MRGPAHSSRLLDGPGSDGEVLTQNLPTRARGGAPGGPVVDDGQRIAVLRPALVGRRQEHERVEHCPVRMDYQVSCPRRHRFPPGPRRVRGRADRGEPNRRWGRRPRAILGRLEDREDLLPEREPMSPRPLPQCHHEPLGLIQDHLCPRLAPDDVRPDHDGDRSPVPGDRDLFALGNAGQHLGKSRPGRTDGHHCRI